MSINCDFQLDFSQNFQKQNFHQNPHNAVECDFHGNTENFHDKKNYFHGNTNDFQVNLNDFHDSTDNFHGNKIDFYGNTNDFHDNQKEVKDDETIDFYLQSIETDEFDDFDESAFSNKNQQKQNVGFENFSSINSYFCLNFHSVY